MTKTEKVAVLIDGSNLYHKLRAPEIGLRNLIRFDYRGLAEWLAKGRKIVRLAYYVGAIRTSMKNIKGQNLRKQQQKLFSHLQSPSQRFQINHGDMMKTDGGYIEKGVDVKIAVDLVVGAYENLYDTAILVSSDTDLVPAIKKVRRLNKMVEYVGFSFQPSLGMQKVATPRLLMKEDVKQFEAPTLL